MPSESLARQNYDLDCEVALNKQINMEMFASYAYMALSAYFDRDDVALPGFAKFFKKASHEERHHADIMVKFQTDRGGRPKFNSIDKPDKETFESGLEAMQYALDLEKRVNASLLEIHSLASSKNDPHMCDWLEDNFLREQVESIRELSGYVTQLKRVGPGLGEYLFDQETLHGEEEK